jgi:hypothetical protein
MSSRSRYVAAAAVVGGGALVARRWRLRRAAEGIRDTIMPTHVQDLPTDPAPREDEAHAPGHRHLAPVRGSRQPGSVRGRPWAKHDPGRRSR